MCPPSWPRSPPRARRPT
uniref:Uncharacterized protein n=1 Tax=Arundo donax TaxID=35708 RepID=A0A0A8Z303_ARUDO